MLMQKNASLCGLFCHRLPSQLPRWRTTLVGFQLEFFEQRLLRKRDYQGRLSFHYFERWMTALVTNRQKKIQPMSSKNKQRLENCLLHGVEWDQIIVHWTHMQARRKMDDRKEFTDSQIAAWIWYQEKDMHKQIWTSEVHIHWSKNLQLSLFCNEIIVKLE